MIVCDISCRPAELMPCTTRAAISHAMSCAKPQAREAARNSTRHARKMRRGAEDIAELAEHRQQHGAREGVADDDPAHVLQRAELTRDRGEGCGDHRVVEGAEERDREQGDNKETESQR